MDRTSITPLRLGHVALAAADPRRLGAFYRELLDLQIVRDIDHPLAGREVQLSGDPARGHELVFMTNEQARHVAFEVGTRALLRSVYRRAREQGAPIPYAHDTGRALSFYIRDPEQNAIEIYWPTGHPRRDRPPVSDEAEIQALVAGSDRGVGS
jgi:catechol-2,3-dioxygenase